MKPTLTLLAAMALGPLANLPAADQPPQAIAALIKEHCAECHDAETKKGKLDLTALRFDLADPKGMERWVQVFDRVENGEMPPKSEDMKPADRQALLTALEPPLHAASKAEADLHGRGPMRRLNRLEFEQNLRDLLALPDLDIREMLPADRESRHFDKVASALDISHVQLTAYLDAVAGIAPAAPRRLVHLAHCAVQVCRARWRLLEWQIEAAYAAAVPEDEIAEAITLAMFPGSIPRFVEACGVWRALIADGRVAASERYRAWAALTGQGGFDEARATKHQDK
jgi:hypothetical protein